MNWVVTLTPLYPGGPDRFIVHSAHVDEVPARAAVEKHGGRCLPVLPFNPSRYRLPNAGEEVSLEVDTNEIRGTVLWACPVPLEESP